MKTRRPWLILDGVYLDPLGSDDGGLAARFRQLTPCYLVREAFDEAMQTIDAGASFWLDPATGNYLVQTAEVLQAVHRSFDGLFQAVEFGDHQAISGIVRSNAPQWTDVPDSALVAAWAMSLAAESIAVIWEAQQLIHTTPTAPNALHALAEARVTHAEYLGQARTALLIAGIHQVFEQQAGPGAGLNAWSILSAATQAPAIARSRKGGKASTQSRREETAPRDKAICESGRRLLKEGHSPRDLASIIQRTAIAEREPGGDKLTTKTIRAILKRGGVMQ